MKLVIEHKFFILFFRRRRRRSPDGHALIEPGLKGRLLISLGVWLLYGLACLLPAAAIDDLGGPSTAPGWILLLFGWFPFSSALAWLANVLLLVGWILFCFRRSQAAFQYGVWAVVLGLTTPLHGYIVRRVHIGFFLWIASMLLFSFATYRATRRNNNQTTV